MDEQTTGLWEAVRKLQDFPVVELKKGGEKTQQTNPPLIFIPHWSKSTWLPSTMKHHHHPLLLP